MKIIIQAGGLGTRMKGLTRNKPKALVPVRNKPIIFHIFDKFKNADFIIIGDYLYDVLDKYLTTFASDRNFILLKSSGKGNSSGLVDALKLVDDTEPVLLIWSDLILPEHLEFDTSFEGCQVGVADFPCSWGVVDNKLVHSKTNINGIAGLYLFNNKSWLSTVPNNGSFTSWLSKLDIPIKTIDLNGCLDIGTLESYEKIENLKYRSRPYNKIDLYNDYVVKTGLTEEAKIFIEREVAWYKYATSNDYKNIPLLLSESPLKLSRIPGNNIFSTALNPKEKENILYRIIDALSALHELKSIEAKKTDLYTEYFSKTIRRLKTIESAIPFSNLEYININGISCVNVLQKQELYRSLVLNNLMETYYTFYHGDCQLTNTLLDENHNIFFIDPRGYFGKTKLFGDVRYDWVKLYYAVVGNFDQFNVKNFTLAFTETSVDFCINSGGWEFLEKEFFSHIPHGQGNKREIELIHSIVWLSLASHAWEDYDSMCIAFYNGLYLFNKWLKEYTNE